MDSKREIFGKNSGNIRENNGKYSGNIREKTGKIRENGKGMGSGWGLTSSGWDRDGD